MHRSSLLALGVALSLSVASLAAQSTTSMMRLIDLDGTLVGTGSLIRDDGKHVSYDCVLRYYGSGAEKVVFPNETFSWIAGSGKSALVGTVADAHGTEKLVLRRLTGNGKEAVMLGTWDTAALEGIPMGGDAVLVAGRDRLQLINLSTRVTQDIGVPSGFEPVRGQNVHAIYGATPAADKTILWRCTSRGPTRVAEVSGKVSSVVELSDGGLIIGTWQPSDSRDGASFSLERLSATGQSATFYSERGGYQPLLQKQGALMLVTYVVYDPGKGMPRRAVLFRGEADKPTERFALRDSKAAALKDGLVVGLGHDGKLIPLKHE